MSLRVITQPSTPSMLAERIFKSASTLSQADCSRNANALNAKNKQSVVTTLQNLRAGLVALEIEFRTKPALKNYLFQIQGISDMAGLAEDQAADGQLTEAGRTLLMVVEKLSDTLVALP